ncbi:MAG: hypothetical protein IJP62_11545 [Treponema sp.]|nr:hypothetical protein [Treponema sp.]
MRKYTAICVLLGLVIAAVFAQTDDYVCKVASPNGAPALALAMMAEKNPENFAYVAAETISAEFANNRSDFIIAPINAGAKLYKMGKSHYVLAAVVTWGNLYIASQKKNFRLKDIKKSGITLFGENTINASVALFALGKNAFAPKRTDYLAGAANTQALLLTNAETIVLTAEPALTAARMKNQNISAFAVNDLLKKATGYDGYAQAGLFVRKETVEQHPEAVSAFLVEAEKSCALCTDDIPAVAKAAVFLGILPNETVAQKAIPGCAVRYLGAKDAKKQVELTANIDLAQFGGALPAGDFYYGER